MGLPLDKALGAARGALGKASGLLRSKLPSARRASPEPFSSVEDGDADLDALLEPNAAPARPAPGPRAGKAALPAIDLRAGLEALLKNKLLLVCAAALSLVLVVLALTSIVVGAPAKAIGPGPGATKEGRALVRALIVPPRSSLRPRMEMEREGEPAYTVQDAIELGIGRAGIDRAALASRNDAEIEALYGTVR